MQPINTSTATLILDSKCALGEGPVWDADSRNLFWLDIVGRSLHRWEPGVGLSTSLTLPQMPGCLGLTTKNNILLGLKDGISLLNPATNQISEIFKTSEQYPNNRFNDGKCTPDGRFLAGTMDMDEKSPNGAVYMLHTDLSVSVVISPVTISNGIAWNPGLTKMFYIDTPTLSVQVFDYDPRAGLVANPRTLISIPPGMGYPDGMTSDMEGRLYIAMWGGYAITVWDGSSGNLLETISVPARNPTSCTFGGANMDALFVTSARIGMSLGELKKYPHSGGIFRIQTNTRGMENYRFLEL